MDLIAAGVERRLDELHAAFATARPFRHCVIDGFLAPEFAQRLLDEFPAFERGNHLNEEGRPGGKSTLEAIRALGDSYRALDDLVQSPAFLAMVGRITGIPRLLYDPMYFGGGTHENRDGQELDVHIDFNYHPQTRWHRRLNLIVYLNHDWDPDWGGALELHRDPYDPGRDEVVEVTPLFNRCVIFETTEHSWHGFRRIRLPPDRAGSSRKSVAFYFYTEARPQDETAPTHSTVYVDRGMPEHLAPGHVLTEADCEELRTLFARQAGHPRRLYREIERLQALLDQGRLSRLAAAVRRRLARRRARQPRAE